MTFHIRHSICRRTACVGTCRPDRARCPLGCIRGTRGVCIVRGPRAQTAGLVEERSDSHAHRRTRREPRTSPRYFEDATFRGGSSIGCHNENVMISRGWIFRLLRAFLNCRGSSDSGEASQAHKVSLHSRFDPDFRALVPIGSQGAAMAALLAALVRRYLLFSSAESPSELIVDEMLRSLSGHIPIHRSSWTASLRTHRCMSQFHRASSLCFAKLLTCCRYDGRLYAVNSASPCPGSR